ncbi:6915_t:CDS:2 [Paraglomus brasilianum]|uniref:6915_t:CDS:1 n=1 Tax=Paraglomus brasilianum TaxID=144538 RepID=A0A9N9GXM8_9GLOM|nr:6915_t:CDS:2 [Paraglomus brasilianum]
MDDKEKKAHRPRQAGSKREKKDKKKTKNDEKHNPKAFAPRSGRKAEKLARRKVELTQKRLHVPLIDRTPLEPPPAIIAVVGPPKTGKTTLIKSLVKRYTKHNLTTIKGPITVVSGKKRRLTFIECANDLNCMIDVAKIADLVLLLIDASFGFEMETFEFLNVLQVHGFPKIMGVLTHLDKFKKMKTLRATKKRLKHRFWTEIYQGAKLFYLSGVINGRYPNMEILNLSRFISVMKFRPLIWRNAHPYLVADRVEDLTDPEEVRQNPLCDRTVTLYGYLHGINLKLNTKMHIPGAGDYYLSDVSSLPDPCPLPDKVRRSLSEKQKYIYAPMSDVGGILYDKDAVYINVPGNFTKTDQGVEQDAGEKMVINLQDAPETLASRLEDSELRVFTRSEPLKATDLTNRSESEGDSDFHNTSFKGSVESVEDESGQRRRKVVFSEGDKNETDKELSEAEDGIAEERKRRAALAKHEVGNDVDGEEIAFAESDSDLDDIMSEQEFDDGYLNSALKWKSNLAEKAKETFHANRRVNLMQLIYDSGKSPEDIANGDYDSSNEKGSLENMDEEEEEDDFITFKKTDRKDVVSLNRVDSVKSSVDKALLAEWDQEETLEAIRNKFITGSLEDKGDTQKSDDEEIYGDFEDLETGEIVKGISEPERTKEGLDQEELSRKKEELKRKFDAEYDDKEEDTPAMSYYDEVKEGIAKQLELNRAEFENDDPVTRAMV